MIRKYTEAEIPTLMNIWEAASKQAHPFLSEEFSKMVKNMMSEKYLPDSDTWVYEKSGKIFGFISMMDNEIGGLFVNPNAQSQGIGRLLVDHMNTFHKVLEVEVFAENKVGLPFYRKTGFSPVKEYFMGGAEQTVIRLRRD